MGRPLRKNADGLRGVAGREAEAAEVPRVVAPAEAHEARRRRHVLPRPLEGTSTNILANVPKCAKSFP